MDPMLLDSEGLLGYSYQHQLQKCLSFFFFIWQLVPRRTEVKEHTLGRVLYLHYATCESGGIPNDLVAGDSMSQKIKIKAR